MRSRSGRVWSPRLACFGRQFAEQQTFCKGENFVVANFCDLFRDPREEYPVSTAVGAWAGSPYERIIQRPMAWKKKYPDRPAAVDTPYTGIENLRPETIAMRDEWLAWKKQVGLIKE